MLRVLQHYLPIRTALLFFSETLILTAVLALGMTQHLWEAFMGVKGTNYASLAVALGEVGLKPDEGVVYGLVSAFLVALVCQVAIGFNDLYEFQVSTSRYERASRFVESAGAALALSVGLVTLAHILELRRVFPGLPISRKVQTLVASLVTAFAVLYLFRILFHGFMRHVNLNLRILILGSRGPAHALASQVLQHPEAGYEVAGMVPEPERAGRRLPNGRPRESDPLVVAPDHEETDRTRALVLEDLRLLDAEVENQGAAMEAMNGGSGARSLLSVVQELEVDLLVVALEDRRQTLPIRELLRCRLAGVDVREREEIFEEITGRIAVAAMRPSYLIFNEGFRRHPWAALAKRTVDIVCALVILALAWPFMLLTALAIRLDSGSPILFTQERVGQDGKLFTLRKFRSMSADAERDTGPVWSSEDDPRITRVGRFIRKTRLDELPQLFNVLGGSMSLVGPRPEREHFVTELAERIPYFHQRHIVKPGLTGWAQINYPYGNTIEDALHKLQFDLFYIKNYSVLFDLSILFNTIKTVVLRKGT